MTGKKFREHGKAFYSSYVYSLWYFAITVSAIDITGHFSGFQSFYFRFCANLKIVKENKREKARQSNQLLGWGRAYKLAQILWNRFVFHGINSKKIVLIRRE